MAKEACGKQLASPNWDKRFLKSLANDDISLEFVEHGESGFEIHVERSGVLVSIRFRLFPWIGFCKGKTLTNEHLTCGVEEATGYTSPAVGLGYDEADDRADPFRVFHSELLKEFVLMEFEPWYGCARRGVTPAHRPSVGIGE